MSELAPTPWRIERVTWLDSTLLEHGAWMDVEDVLDSMSAVALRHESVGYIVAESDIALVLAGSRNDAADPLNCDTRIGDVTVIPAACVVKRKRMR